MANEQQIALLKQGVDAWNAWRENHSEVPPDLREANLSGLNLSGAYLNGGNFIEAYLGGAQLSKAYLSGAKLSGSYLIEANLQGAYLIEANLSGAYLRGANLTGANLSGAYLRGANLTGANLSGADLSGANLRGAYLKGANLGGADLMFAQLSDSILDKANFSGARVYGVSAWGVKLEGANQSNLVVTRGSVPVITVDNLEVAQFIGQLLHNETARSVIDTLTTKVVLIMGCFKPVRRVVLNAIRDALRRHHYLPILCDFPKTPKRDITELVSTLARMAQFVIVDITDANCLLQELQRLVPQLTSIPVQVLMHTSASEFEMFENLKQVPGVLEAYRYENLADITASLDEKIIFTAEAKAKDFL